MSRTALKSMHPLLIQPSLISLFRLSMWHALVGDAIILLHIRPNGTRHFFRVKSIHSSFVQLQQYTVLWTLLDDSPLDFAAHLSLYIYIYLHITCCLCLQRKQVLRSCMWIMLSSSAFTHITQLHTGKLTVPCPRNFNLPLLFALSTFCSVVVSLYSTNDSLSLHTCAVHTLSII